MVHDDLREEAINAIANYMHHQIFDEIWINMRPFCLKQAEMLMAIVDTAIRQANDAIHAELNPSSRGDRHAA